MKCFNLLFINSTHTTVTVVGCNDVKKALKFYKSIPLITENRNHILVYCEEWPGVEQQKASFERLNKLTIAAKINLIKTDGCNPDFIELLESQF